MSIKKEDGPHNCESLAVDTERNEILLLTKTKPQHCGLYVLPLSLHERSHVRTAKRIASPFLPFTTGMDLSPDGRHLVVASMLDGIAVARNESQTWAEAFETSSQRLPLPQRRQGETICFGIRGQTLFANSEKKQQPLWKRRWNNHESDE